MNKNIIKGILGISIVSVFLTGCSIQSINFNIDFTKYSKEDTSEYTYEIKGDTLAVNSDSSSISIKKDNSDKVKVKINKTVGGNDEEKLQEALDNIKAECNEDRINISSPRFEGLAFSSINNKTEIIIPDNIDNLEIKNDVGDIILQGKYEDLSLECATGDLSCNGSINNLKINNNVGDISINGEAGQCSIESNIGDINLDLENLKDDYSYFIKGDVGSLQINLPKDSKIQLKGDLKNKIEINGVQSGDKGAVFDIDTKASDVTIEGI